MKKTRVILTALAIALALAQIPISRLPEKGVYAAEIISAVLFVAALGIILFSFFRVDELPSGELCFDPENWLWKVLIGFHQDTNKPRLTHLSLCKAYWTTVSLIVCGTAVIGGIGYFLFFALPTIIREILKDPKAFFVVIGYVVSVIVLVSPVVALLVWLCKRVPAFGKALGVVALIVIGCFGVTMVTVAPIGAIMKDHHVGVRQAILIYIRGVLLIIGIVIAAVAVLWAAFKYLSPLRNTWLGRFFRQIKKNFCPNLTACYGSGYAN